MSNDKSPFHGWRARTHYLTRNRRFLLRTSASIIAFGMLIACVIVMSFAAQEDAPQHLQSLSQAQIRLHDEFLRLQQEDKPTPRQLAFWLRLLLGQLPKTAEAYEAVAFQEFSQTGKIADYDVALLITQHATTDAPAGMFRLFLDAALTASEPAAEQLKHRADAKPPGMLAAELYASVQKRRGNTHAAMLAFYMEGLHFPDATAAREEALRLSLTQRDLEVLRSIASQPGWIESCHPLLQHHAGAILGDVWMQWSGLVRHRFSSIPYGMLALAFFAAALWYFILVQHSDHERWRWARPIAALMAGVASVWPTLTVLAYQEFVQGMTADAPFPHDLIYYVAGVGLREEACKLALFALFLPWLLWRRQPGLALLTGAFVGLGFSLEENVGYYQDFGGTIAWTRFLSANFLHISLTGICAHSLYNMLRTRFAHAEEFIGTFIFAVLAHGGYDYLAGGSFDEGGLFSIIVLAVIAFRFIDLLGQETRPVRLTIAPRAVFTFGSAILIAISLILGAWSTRSMEGVALAGQGCLSMVPIALIYWRRFENA